MNAKTMEGIVGARTSVTLSSTPMRVYDEARRKGDTATMERALGYAGELSDKAQEYQAKADKGMEEDAKDARERAKLQREEVIQKRREEHEKLEERIQENRMADGTNTDTVEISEAGKVVFRDDAGSGGVDSVGTLAEAAEEPVTYTKTGEVISAEESTGFSVSV